VGSKGVTRREHFKQVKAWGELEPPVEFPQLLIHIWDTFVELHSARGSNGMGPNPIGYEDAYYWSKVTGVPLSYWEIATIKRLDNKWMNVQAESSN